MTSPGQSAPGSPQFQGQNGYYPPAYNKDNDLNAGQHPSPFNGAPPFQGGYYPQQPQPAYHGQPAMVYVGMPQGQAAAPAPQITQVSQTVAIRGGSSHGCSTGVCACLLTPCCLCCFADAILNCLCGP